MTQKNVNSAKEAIQGLDEDAPHILVVDDDSRIRSLLNRFLQENQFRVSTAKNAQEARRHISGLDFDMIILDVMMPGESGLQFAEFVRGLSDIPILILSARDTATQRIEGLEKGVDDYLPKPFEPRELLLRVNNILKRSAAQPASLPDKLHFGACVFYVDRGELKNEGETVRLTSGERELLRQFAASPGKPISRSDIASGAEGSRAVDVQINRLRRKIEPDPSNPVYLQTVRGSGYILYTD